MYFDDDDNFSDDSLGFNVKISPNHDLKPPKNKNKNKNIKNLNKNYQGNEFWILSGTSNGSMLLHKLYNDTDDDDDNINAGNNYNDYL